MTVYLCELCDFTTDHKTNFERHNKTKKHIRNEEEQQKQEYNNMVILSTYPCQCCNTCHYTMDNTNSVDEKTYACKYCGKTYAHRQSRFKHQQTCTHPSKTAIQPLDETEPQPSDINTIKEELIMIKEKISLILYNLSNMKE